MQGMTQGIPEQVQQEANVFNHRGVDPAAQTRTWPWQRLSVSIIAAMLLMTLVMALSMVAVSNYSVQRQFDNLPPELRNQLDREGAVDVGRQLAQGITDPRFMLLPTSPAPSLSPDTPRQSKAERIRRDLLSNLLWAIAISGAVAVLFGALLARLISRPVTAVSKAAQRVASGDLSARAQQFSGNLELTHLSQNFNSMAKTLETLERERREMIADIAHELRTPLAVVQARLDAFEDGVLEASPPEIALISMQIGLLTRLVSDLRILSLADAGRLPLQVAPLDLSALASRITLSFVSKARAAGVALHTDLPGFELPVEADRDRLGQVLVNLLENAVRYTPPNGQITVFAGRREGQAVLRVRDSGPGFPPGSQDKLFARFYRADESRARDGGGSGLGLAIVAALVRAHGGEVHARNVPGAGAEVEVRLPLSEEGTDADWNGFGSVALPG